jgi:hypothetical protein
MALLSFRGISTPSLPAQGEQRRFSLLAFQHFPGHFLFVAVDHNISAPLDYHFGLDQAQEAAEIVVAQRDAAFEPGDKRVPPPSLGGDARCRTPGPMFEIRKGHRLIVINNLD